MLATLMACFLLAVGIQAPVGQVERDKQRDPEYPMAMLRPVNFNYLIYSNKVIWPEDPVACGRNVYVLMDENAFSEVNLKELFSALSDAFPEPKTLSIMVHTSLDQVRPLGPSNVSEQPDLPNANKHHLAGYFRNGDDEFFRYIAHPPEGKWTTVVLKGVDPSATEHQSSVGGRRAECSGDPTGLWPDAPA
jgi:hypothetical protein